ncbi:hypothetical protein [Candidatus Ruminimicrobium bovinum]|uniref:hypothetical protein n=1 Tax=Candidatus Ruminimicrobium bovinum TaxID=3242779 RepID=UPI0039B836BB
MNISNLNFKAIIVFIVSFMFVSFTFAETVILNDGTTYKGNIHHQDDNVVYIVQGEDLIKINRKDVKEIKKDEKINKDSIETLDLDENIIEKKNEFVIKVGYDWNGDYEAGNDKIKAPNGISAFAEFHHYIKNIVGVGLGIGGCNPRDAKFYKGDFYIFPAYLSVKLRSKPTELYKYGYVVGQVGYNLLNPNDTLKKSVDMEGGLYYGVGFGIVVSHMVFELLYSFNNGKAGKDDKIDFKYSKYTFSVGYAF